jgi:hypothetical protein
MFLYLGPCSKDPTPSTRTYSALLCPVFVLKRGVLVAGCALAGETGSYRYMAPEVFRHEPYNNKVDVYR